MLDSYGLLYTKESLMSTNINIKITVKYHIQASNKYNINWIYWQHTSDNNMKYLEKIISKTEALGMQRKQF